MQGSLAVWQSDVSHPDVPHRYFTDEVPAEPACHTRRAHKSKTFIQYDDDNISRVFDIVFTLYLPLLTIFFATVISVFVVFYCVNYIRKYGPTQQVTTFTIFAVAVSLWAFFAMLQLTATTYDLTFFAYQLLHFGAWGTPIPLLCYSLSLGPAGRWVTWPAAGVLGLLLLPLFVLLFTAPTQYLFIEPTLQPLGSFSVIEHGNKPIYDAYLAYIYLLVFPGLGYISY